jgi:hypothetical protein
MNHLESSPYRQVMIVTCVIVIVHAIFLFAIPLFPFVDLPNHLAEATIYKYYGEPGNSLSQYYKPVPWFFPNTFHTVFCSLFPSIELGNKVFTILCVAMVLFSVFLVIRQLKGNPWYGLLAILFVYNYNLTFGFVGFAISIPSVIFLFYLILRDIERNKFELKLAIAFVLILIFLMHAQMALFGVVLYGVMTLFAYRKDFKKVFIRGVLVPLPLVVLIFTWWFSREEAKKEDSTTNFLLQYYQEYYVKEFIDRFRLVIFDNYQVWTGMAGVLLAVVLFACIIAPIIYFKPWQKEAWKQNVTNAIYPLVLLTAALACYMFLPTGLPGQTPLSQRFCSLVNLSLVIVASVLVKDIPGPRFRFFTAAICIIYSLIWFEYLFTFNQQNRGFKAEFFQNGGQNQRLAGLIYQNKFRRSRVYIHFPNYFLVWGKGIVASKIIDYRFGVVRRVASEEIVPFYYEYIGDKYQHMPTYSSQDYLLVRGKSPVDVDLNLQNFTLVRETGVWRLYRNRDSVSLSRN